jgi:putative transposase
MDTTGSRLEDDGLGEWQPSFLQLASTQEMLKRLVETSRSSKKKRVSPGQQRLPFVFEICLNQIPDE